MTNGLPPGSSLWATGEREWCNSSRCRPTTRSWTTSSPIGFRRNRHRRATGSICATGSTGSRTNPFPQTLGRCIATRLGRGGEPGQPRPFGVRKFLVEFLGGPLRELPNGVKPELVLWASRGRFSSNHARGRARRCAGALARSFRSHRRWTRACRDAPLSEIRRESSDRDLALSIPPLRDRRAPGRVLIAADVIPVKRSASRDRKKVDCFNSLRSRIGLAPFRDDISLAEIGVCQRQKNGARRRPLLDAPVFRLRHVSSHMYIKV